MKAIVQTRYGPPEEVLELREIEKPEVGDGEVLVRVRATSVHADVWHVVAGIRVWPASERKVCVRNWGSGKVRVESDEQQFKLKTPCDFMAISEGTFAYHMIYPLDQRLATYKMMSSSSE